MPTPFYHLSIALELLDSPAVSEAQRNFLATNRCAFFFGKTAPDVQTLSGQERPATHFYRLPLIDTTPAWQRLFKQHPNLADPTKLPAEQAAFMAGYICHLQADLIWIEDLFVPYFLPRISLGERKTMGYLHNVLRAYLDERILSDLPFDLGDCLRRVKPAGWLPFVEDGHLNNWRDFLANQLAPGAQAQTVEVFAKRLDLPVEAFLELLHSEERLEEELFSFVPLQVLVEYRNKLVTANAALLMDYLAGLT